MQRNCYIYTISQPPLGLVRRGGGLGAIESIGIYIFSSLLLAFETVSNEYFAFKIKQKEKRQNSGFCRFFSSTLKFSVETILVIFVAVRRE